MVLPCDSAVPFLESYPKEMRACVHEKMWSQLFIVVMAVRAKHSGQPACPCAMTIQNVVCPHHEVPLRNKEEQITDSFYTMMNSKNMMNEKKNCED